MKTIRLVILGISAFALSAFSYADTPKNSNSITDLEKQIQDTVRQTGATAADKAAMHRLNDLKIKLINALEEEFQRDATNNSNSSSAQRAAKDSLTDSLGTWTTGLLESPASSNPGPASRARTGSTPPTFLYSDTFSASFIGGVEQSGYSSQANNTNGFLNAYFQSPYLRPEKQLAPALWGRIRLLSGPLPSTVNVIAAITDPSGTITSSNLTNVGQVTDYVLGPIVRLHQTDHSDNSSNRISFIAGVGATTPLSSTNIQYSLQAPPENSAQCLQLISLYPSLTNGSVAPACKLINPVTKEDIKTISFAPIDRSNFLFKYGAGFRFSHIYPQNGQQLPYTGSLDLTFGQDESITGGTLHGAVFKVDGIYPLAFGASSFLYIFGSTSMRLTSNKNTNPVVLATAQTPALPLSTSVALLPLTQPNRDFYRFGVGLNITAIFCKLSPAGCGNSKGDTPQKTELAAEKLTNPSSTTHKP